MSSPVPRSGLPAFPSFRTFPVLPALRALPLLPILAILVVLLCSYSCAQAVDTAPPVDSATNEAEVELVQDLISRASNEAREFRRQDGTPEDPDHPLRDWSDLLWRYREIHPGTEAASQAAQAALSMKGRVGDVDEMYALAGEIDPDDLLWKETRFLLNTAWQEEDFNPVIELCEQKIAGASDPEVRSALQVLLGGALLASERRDEALTALELAAEEAPDSRWAEEALDIKRVATELAPGQPAQWPEVTDTKGNPVSLYDFAGRHLLLNYWASW